MHYYNFKLFIMVALVSPHVALCIFPELETANTNTVLSSNNETFVQCENDIIYCLKIKTINIIDRALSINNIPVVEGLIITKNYGDIKSSSINATFESNNILDNGKQRNLNIDNMLWDKLQEFIKTRSFQLNIDKMLSTSFKVIGNSLTEGRGKKDKSKSMYLLMMMKGGMMAMAYKALAILAGKALLVSKLALIVALLVAIKKLNSGGGHSHQKTTYEIVKTPIVTHTHQYSASSPQASAELPTASFEGAGNYGRSIENLVSDDETLKAASRREINLGIFSRPSIPLESSYYAVPPRYIARIMETSEGRSFTNGNNKNNATSIADHKQVPYAHIVAFRNHLLMSRKNISKEINSLSNSTVNSSSIDNKLF